MSSLPTYWFIFQNDRLLLAKEAEDYSLLTNKHFSLLKSSILRELKLGTLNEADCYCAEIAEDAPLPDEVAPFSLRKGLELLGTDWYHPAAKAYAVINWDKTHQFCGRCGSKTLHKASAAFERICPACGLSLYPRISPSMIVLIEKEDKILLARSPHFPPGRYGLVAGFIEVGESIEDAVHREVQEEVGIKVKNLRYFGSQPWPFPDSLMIGFFADYASGEIQVDNVEIVEAGWYRFDNLPSSPPSVSIARKLIDHFVVEATKKFGR